MSARQAERCHCGILTRSKNTKNRVSAAVFSGCSTEYGSVEVDIASSIWLNNFSRRLVVVSAKSTAIIDMRRSYRRNRADVRIADCY
jgi:hypothetical protein